MRAHPKTRYTRAAPRTWALIRGAYLSGLSAPTVAARFGVTVHSIRKRARREGWTKTAWAQAEAALRGGALTTTTPPGIPGPSSPNPPLSLGDEEADAAAAITAGPLEIRVSAVARRALANAAQAVRLGDGREAVALARAAELIAKLDEWLPYSPGEPDTEAAAETRQAVFHRFLRQQALTLARDLKAGRPLPEAYADLQAEWEAGQ